MKITTLDSTTSEATSETILSHLGQWMAVLSTNPIQPTTPMQPVMTQGPLRDTKFMFPLMQHQLLACVHPLLVLNLLVLIETLAKGQRKGTISSI